VVNFKRKDEFLDNIRRTLESIGYKVTLGAEIRGESGAVHYFDLLAENKNARTAIHLYENLQIMHVLSAIAKFKDTYLSQIIICNKASEEAKNITSYSPITQYIRIIENNDIEEIKRLMATRTRA